MSLRSQSRPLHTKRHYPPALHLEVSETEDEDADRKRLASLFRLLQEQPGSDRVTLTIHTRGGQSIELALLPTARLDVTLRASLQAAASTVDQPVT